MADTDRTTTKITRIDISIANWIELLFKFWLAQLLVSFLLATIGALVGFLGMFVAAVIGGVYLGG